MEKMTFYEKQPTVVVSGNKALILLNEQVEVEKYGGMDEESEILERNAYKYDGYWIDDISSEADVFTETKQSILKELAAYDASSEVNSFSVNGTTAWYDKATRVGLMNSTTIAKTLGYKTATLWFGDTKFDLDCDKVIDLLSKIEMYALDCYNRTAAHRQAIEELTDIADVLQYDFKSNYPKKLEITL
mgnify:CR=1 FL=1